MLDGRFLLRRNDAPDAGDSDLVLIAWEKKVERNFTYDVKELCRFSADERQVEVYIDAEKKYLAFPVPDGKSH